jgi:hypothetical protein
MRRHDRFASIRLIQSLTTNVLCSGTVPCDHHSTNVHHLPAIVRSRRSASGYDLFHSEHDRASIIAWPTVGQEAKGYGTLKI